jgi:hypothetical protein
MKIRVDPFDRDSIDQAIRLVKQYKKDFAVKEKEFVRRLAEIGLSTATYLFHMADYDGTKDVVVTMNHRGNKATVVAHGQTVGFIEFGTGVNYREWDGSNVEYTPPPHGSYGKGHGKQQYGWWFVPNKGVKAQHTYGNPPAEAMLTARDDIVMWVTQIAREVWR